MANRRKTRKNPSGWPSRSNIKQKSHPILKAIRAQNRKFSNARGR